MTENDPIVESERIEVTVGSALRDFVAKLNRIADSPTALAHAKVIAEAKSKYVQGLITDFGSELLGLSFGPDVIRSILGEINNMYANNYTPDRLKEDLRAAAARKSK